MAMSEEQGQDLNENMEEIGGEIESRMRGDPTVCTSL